MTTPTFETNTQSPLNSLKPSHMALRVPNFDVSKTWFVEKLDFKVIQEWTFGDLLLAYIAPPNSNNFWIELIGDKNGKHSDVINENLHESFQNYGYHHLCFEVDNVDETVAFLQERAVKIIGSTFNLDAIGKRLAFFADPWGNLFELASNL